MKVVAPPGFCKYHCRIMSNAPRRRYPLSTLSGLGLVGLTLAAALPVWPWHAAMAGVIFAASYAALAAGRIPGLAIDRAGIALVGACLMIASGALDLRQAYQALDLDTLTLLLGVMIVTANLRLSGLFNGLARALEPRIRAPLTLLAGIMLVAGLASAFLVNDTLCLVMAPLVADLAKRLKRRPLPYLLALAMAANIGSVATLTGNPQNMLIGSASRIPYSAFAAALAPVALLGLLAAGLVIVLGHRRDFTAAAAPAPAAAPRPPLRQNRALALRALAAALAMVALFFAGVAPAKAAILTGGLLLLTRRLKSHRVYREIDWSLLLMFAGLFILTAGAERALLTPALLARVQGLGLERALPLTLVTALLSTLVSNVPAILLLKPFLAPLADARHAWLVAAMASTLAGNAILPGSVANLIVAQAAGRAGIRIGFWEHARIGLPVTVLTLAIGVFWLA
ncbi:inner membrane protein YbiR [mine drainage metagenome]|uniref:Inner membrane protein YbiR n=1 Tax=mine drainage metagenome TaxID=410659 RepID=A0A1J5RAQ2_9ZZZZ